MLISVPKESRENEKRVALTPSIIKRLKSTFKDIEIAVEKNAGKAAHFLDKEYESAGAKLVTAKQAFSGDIIVKVTPPTKKEAKNLKKSTLLIGNLDPFASEPLFKQLSEDNVNALSMERIPRISRAQAMDTLSSQAGIGGYLAALQGAQHLNKFFPLMMTAAGSSKPAKVIVLGVGVAGLQAIATAKRLGASVEAFDIRPETAEQVESLGAKFITLDIGEDGSGEGGYAKELSEEGKKKQQAALQEYLTKADVVITTAQIPGRPAPILVTKEAVNNMRPGSVIVDMAAGGYNATHGVAGGNCPLTKADEVTEVNDVILVGHTNYPSMMAGDASNFFAANVMNLLKLLLKNEDNVTTLNINLEDEIIDKSLSVYEGTVR